MYQPSQLGRELHKIPSNLDVLYLPIACNKTRDPHLVQFDLWEVLPGTPADAL